MEEHHKAKKQKILDLEAEVRSVKSRYVNVLKSSNNEIRLLESSQREEDEIITGLRGALESKSTELDSLRTKYINLRADHEHESDLFTQECEDLLCLLESEGIDNLASLDSLDLLLEQEFPEVHLRSRVRKINPLVLKTLVVLRIALSLSLRKCVVALVLVGNNMFNQKWRPSGKEFYANNRIMKFCLPSMQNTDESKVDYNSAPSISYIKSSVENIMEPMALKSICERVKNYEKSTISLGHYTEHRYKFQTQNLTAYMETDSGKQTVNYMSLGLSNVYNSDATSSCDELKKILNLGAVLDTESTDSRAVAKSLQEILCKIKYAVTDGASNMIAAVEMFSEWRNKNCFNVNIDNLVWIHCNAHLIPAFDSGVEKILVSIEEKAKMEKSVVKDFNETFLKYPTQ